MHFLNFKTNQVYHIVFQVYGILKDEDKLKRKLILDKIFILYKPVYWDRMVRFCAYTFCQRKKRSQRDRILRAYFFCAYTLIWRQERHRILRGRRRQCQGGSVIYMPYTHNFLTLCNTFAYLRLLGILLYLTKSRPDIMAAVSFAGTSYICLLSTLMHTTMHYIMRLWSKYCPLAL